MAWAPTPSPPERVQVWASQLANNDFPPVCAMTGAPAETWRKFRFSTAPPWAYALLLLLCTGVGLLIVFLAMLLVSRRASGHLPLTRGSSRQVALAIWIPAGLVIATVALWVLGIVVAVISNDETGSAIASDLFIVSALPFIAGVLGWLVIKPLLGPRASVMERRGGDYDRLVELRNVHPAFVAAVQQIHQARAAFYASTYPGQNVPLAPGSSSG